MYTTCFTIVIVLTSFQMYCDFNRRIINVDPRWPGSVNDAYAFNASPIGDMSKLGENDEDGPLGKFILLADSA